MISKNKQKYLSQLQQKKFREEYRSFLVEGNKSVTELLTSDYPIEIILGTKEFYLKNQSEIVKKNIPFEEISINDLEKTGTFNTNNAAIAVAKMKENKPIYAGNDEMVLVLDDVKDPGNLGTIIRIADWYGIKKVILSEFSVELENPKVIAASMGSFLRVNCFRTNLEEYFKELKGTTILGAFLDGKSIHQFDFEKTGYLVMGSESHGISHEISKYITQKITIPAFGQAESLNVGVATAIILDNYRRVKGKLRFE